AIALCFRPMRTKVDCVKVSGRAIEFSVQDAVNFMDGRFRKIAALDAGLIRNQNGFEPAVVDTPYGLACPWEWFIQSGMIHVSDFLGHGAVPIHENCFSLHFPRLELKYFPCCRAYHFRSNPRHAPMVY